MRFIQYCLYVLFDFDFDFFAVLSKGRSHWIHETVTLVEWNPVINSINGKPLPKGSLFTHWYFAWAQAFACLTSVLSSHFNAPKFYGSLRNRSIMRYSYMTTLAYTFRVVFSVALGLCGYFAYGRFVEESITSSMPSASVAVGIAQLAMVLVLLSTYPLIFMVFYN